MASLLLGHQQNIPLNRYDQGELEQPKLLGISSKRNLSQPDSLEKIKLHSDSTVMQGKSSYNEDIFSANSLLQAQSGKKNLVQANNALNQHSSTSNVLSGLSNGRSISEICGTPEGSKPDVDAMVVYHCGGANLEPVGDDSVLLSNGVIVSQAMINGAGNEVNDQNGSVSESGAFLCGLQQGSNLGQASDYVHLAKVDSEAIHEAKHSEDEQLNGKSKVSVGLWAVSEVTSEAKSSEDEQAKEPGVFKREDSTENKDEALNVSDSEVVTGPDGVQIKKSLGDDPFMHSGSGDDHGAFGNLISVSNQIAEYNKELVIPEKFTALSGSLNISKACFYAVCNRLIEVIDEILDMSSNMGNPFSNEIQKGIKEVMTNRQTRALSMIMDTL